MDKTKKEQIYLGTDGLTLRIAINRLYELLDKQPLGGKDKDFYNESKQCIEKDINSIIKGSKGWEVVKDNLTPKQWQKIWEEV